MRPTPPPFFYIYGQPVRDVVPNFVHVERVGDRQRFHEGAVQAHSHPHLHQLSFWTKARGQYCVGDTGFGLVGQAMTWMPSGVVHGFDVTPDSDAIVVSMSHDFLNGLFAELAMDQVQALRHSPVVHILDRVIAERLLMTFEDIEREYKFPSWAQSQAIVSHLRAALITLARLIEQVDGPGGQTKANTGLYARFLAEIDERFREQLTVEDYAALLGATPYLLNRASQDGAGVRASHVIRNRVIQEAKRLLLFTMLDAASVGFAIGFENPAHFGRYFKQAVGQTPAIFRQRNHTTSAGAVLNV